MIRTYVRANGNVELTLPSGARIEIERADLDAAIAALTAARAYRSKTRLERWLEKVFRL